MLWMVDNFVDGGGLFLFVLCYEDDVLLIVLIYGYGDVVCGYDVQWCMLLLLWMFMVDGDCWYGCGSVDNKGQYMINLIVLVSVFDVCGGWFGFNVKLLIEMGEEIGLLGFDVLCCQECDVFVVDVLIVFDGLCIVVVCLMVFFGLCGLVNFMLSLCVCDGVYYFGNWGGLLCNLVIVFVYVFVSFVDVCGVICVVGLCLLLILVVVCDVFVDFVVGGGFGDLVFDVDWGEFGLFVVECVFGWNMFEIFVFKVGNLEYFVNVILFVVYVYCQLCFVVGIDWQVLYVYLCVYFDVYGFVDVEIDVECGVLVICVLLDDLWVCWVVVLFVCMIGKKFVILLNLGGMLLNDVFVDMFGLLMLWVLYLYLVCLQYVFDEYLFVSVVSEGLQMMVGFFWDFGDDVLFVCCVVFVVVGVVL